uniref:Glycine-rich protein n=1 Tax=Kalanchoe fedtschenkoi TaxID=63787 RepID=A0A7N0V786_KALFE
MATKGSILFIVVVTLFQFSLALTLTGLFQGSKGVDGMRGEEKRVAGKRVVHENCKAYAGGRSGGRSGEAGSGAGGSSSSSPDAAGGAAVIPVYAAGAKDNHHHNRRHSAGNIINHPHSLIRLSALGVAIALSLLVNPN